MREEQGEAVVVSRGEAEEECVIVGLGVKVREALKERKLAVSLVVEETVREGKLAERLAVEETVLRLLEPDTLKEEVEQWLGVLERAGVREGEARGEEEGKRVREKQGELVVVRVGEAEEDCVIVSSDVKVREALKEGKLAVRLAVEETERLLQPDEVGERVVVWQREGGWEGLDE